MLRDCGRNFFGIFFGNVLTSSGIHQFSFLSDQLSLVPPPVHPQILRGVWKVDLCLALWSGWRRWNAEASNNFTRWFGETGSHLHGRSLWRLLVCSVVAVKQLSPAKAEGWIRVKVILSESLCQKSPSCSSRRDSADLEPFWFQLQFVSSCGFHLGYNPEHPLG